MTGGGHSHICCSHCLDGLLTQYSKEGVELVSFPDHFSPHRKFFPCGEKWSGNETRVESLCIYFIGSKANMRVVKWLMNEMQRSQRSRGFATQSSNKSDGQKTNGQGRDYSIYGSDHPLIELAARSLNRIPTPLQLARCNY